MTRIVIDSFAWVEYLNGTELGSKVKKIIEENEEIFSSALTIAEVVSKVARKNMDVQFAFKVITSNSNVMNADEELSFQAGLFHSEMRKTLKDFGLADAYVLATAKRLQAKILTGDPHFKDIKDAIILK